MRLDDALGSFELAAGCIAGLGVLARELEGEAVNEVRHCPVDRGRPVVVASSLWALVATQLELTQGANVVAVDTLHHDAVARYIVAYGALDQLSQGVQGQPCRGHHAVGHN